MDRTANRAVNYPSDFEVISKGLKWLVTNQKFREGKKREEQPRAAVYSGAWVKIIKRCQEFQDKRKLRNLFLTFDQNDLIIQDLREILSIDIYQPYEEDEFDMLAEVSKFLK